MAQKGPYLAGKAGDRCLAIGACHRDHQFRLGPPKPKRGGVRQRHARVFGHDNRRITARQFLARNLGPPLQIGQDDPPAPPMRSA